MKLRIVLVLAMWAAMIVGALTLIHGAGVPAGVVTGAIAGVIGVRTIVAVRRRVRRMRAWFRTDETEVPTGSRRVLLARTGLAETHLAGRG